MTPDFQLLDAVQRGNVTDIDLALTQGASIHSRDFGGRSVLEVAEKCHKNNVVGPLIARGAYPNQQVGKKGNSLLHDAARTSNLGFGAALLENGANVDSLNLAGQTPLHFAAKLKHEYFADTLLRAGADVRAADPKTGNTPLHLAAINGDKAMIRLLLTHGAIASTTNKVGYTALHEAAAAGQTEAVNFLLEKASFSPRQRQDLIPRVRLAAELHGQKETAAALQAAELDLNSSFAVRVRESQSPDRYR